MSGEPTVSVASVGTGIWSRCDEDSSQNTDNHSVRSSSLFGDWSWGWERDNDKRLMLYFTGNSGSCAVHLRDAPPMADMKKLSPDELAAKIVKFDVLPVFSADDERGGW